MTAASPRLLDRRYRITNVLGESIGERYYTARHVELDIPVRIVTMELPAGAESDPRHASAAHLWALTARATLLRHPSLARVRDCFRSRRTFSIVAELAQGETLAERIGRRGRLSLRETLTYGLQLCDLLAYVSREGAVLTPLRSIAPDSLVVQDDDRIVLTDLGTSHWLRPSDVAHRSARFPYMAPEVLAGGPVDGRADVYSVAAVLYAALAGEPPAPFGLGLLPLSTLAPLAPAALCETIERALDPDPSLRYARPEDFGRALGRSVRATMPGVAALARQPRRQAASTSTARLLVSDQQPRMAMNAVNAVEAQAGGWEGARRWPRVWAQELSRVTAPRPLRRTGGRALAAISSALRLGA